MMKPPIPIQNLYYLLAYAWNHKLDEADLVEVDAASCPDLNNLFARILENTTRHLLRRGLDRSYISFEEDTPRIRGRIDFSESAKRQTWKYGKLNCVYDELSPDVLHNRILKSTLRLLRSDRTVAIGTRKQLGKILDSFEQVSPLRVQPRHFHRVQLHRNNRSYRFLLHLCELIHASHLPDQSSAGNRRFRDFTRDEKTMAEVFEKFVRNFATKHLPEATVSAMRISWNASSFDNETSSLLPGMLTDVTVAWPERKMILDCKYYQDALTSYHERRQFKTGNLYQLHAYLTNKAQDRGWEQVEGILLYPTNGYRLDHSFTLHNQHPVRLVTLDLDQEWPAIHADLLQVFLGSNHGSATNQ